MATDTPLTREFKVQLIKAVFNKEEFDVLIGKASPYDLSDIQEFMWDAALYVGRDEDGRPLSRDALTSRMMPTTEYWRSQLCGEPLDTCRGRSCFVSHPVCAGNKLKGQIEAIRQFFDRRKRRALETEDAMLMLLMSHVNENNYASGGVYDSMRKPQFTVGSRVLDGDTLKQVIDGMNDAVASAHSDTLETKITVGEAVLLVHSQKCKDGFVAIATSETDNKETLGKVFKKIEAGIERIVEQ